MTNDNSHTITGTVYAKEFTEIPGKKDPTAKYAKYILTLEVKTGKSYEKNGKVEYHTSTTFPQLESFGINLDHIEIGDFVSCNFFMQGRKYNDREGKEKIMTKAMITYVKHADIDQGGPTHKGKVKTDSMSSTADLKQDNVFTGAVPDDAEGLSDLPF